MTHDTAIAIWYRRIDRRCFTGPRPAGDVNGRPALEVTYDARTVPGAAAYAATTTEPRTAPADDRRGWSGEAVADAL